MDGQGRALDNIPIERLWRTVKYEAVYLRTYETVAEASANLKVYIDWYNKQRCHSGIHKYRPVEIILGQEITTNLIFTHNKKRRNLALWVIKLEMKICQENTPQEIQDNVLDSGVHFTS